MQKITELYIRLFNKILVLQRQMSRSCSVAQNR